MRPPTSRGTSEGPFVRELTPVDYFVRELAREIGLADHAADKRARRLIARLARWTTAQGLPLERELIFDPDTVERFVEFGLANDRSAATYRSVLRALGPRVTRSAPWEPKPKSIKRRDLAKPYSPSELEMLFDDASRQPTAFKRQAARTLLVLGRGAGLDGRWVTKVRPKDISRRGPAVVVTVGVPAPREIVVCAEYEAALVSLRDRCRDRYLVGGNSTSKNRTGHLVSSFDVPTGHPAIAPARLRSTWLLGHLDAGTRLPELCRTAGVVGTGVYADLLGYLGPIPDEEAVAMLRMVAR